MYKRQGDARVEKGPIRAPHQVPPSPRAHALPTTESQTIDWGCEYHIENSNVHTRKRGIHKASAHLSNQCLHLRGTGELDARQLLHSLQRLAQGECPGRRSSDEGVHAQAHHLALSRLRRQLANMVLESTRSKVGWTTSLPSRPGTA